MKKIEIRTEDELSRLVFIRLQNDQIISVSLEERDALELVLVLRGYYRLVTGTILPMDKEEIMPVEDLAPPYLSQHKVLPEKWSYTNQQQIKKVSFAAQPTYQNVNRKANGFYNTVGRQSKIPLAAGLGLDNNMNTSISNRNHQFVNYGTATYDLHNVVTKEILETGVIEARNDEVFRRVKEMQKLVENSEKYLTEQQHLAKLTEASEWQETSVDIDSDNDSGNDDDAPGTLHHSDSLLLLTRGSSINSENRQSFTNAAIEMLRSEINQSESDNDSIYTPHNSPKHNFGKSVNGKSARVSFGLHSPDTGTTDNEDLKSYLQKLKNQGIGEVADSDIDTITDLYVFDPEIIDLTMFPPPVTPDELDCALPTPINVPPKSFADSMDKLNKLGVLHENLDLEEFLASVTVPPPTQKITPAVELTPEEIMSYIIPPPPDVNASLETLTINNSIEPEKMTESLPVYINSSLNGVKRRNSNSSVKSNIIEYATVDRKGPFTCCAKTKKSDETDLIQPPPRRSSDEKPPERPPKNIPQERQRSHSLTSNRINSEYPPKLPPKGETNQPAPPHLFLPPKKPPLPPVPPLEVLRSRKNCVPPTKPNSETRTAGIGSPHLQRNRNMYSEVDNNFGNVTDDNKLSLCHSTAVSTPTSPYMGLYLIFNSQIQNIC